jgi:8-oxo-dGTP diphosphatase
MSSPVEERVVRVLAAVIQVEERYLVCLRPRHKRHGGLWEFPGGKLEEGETLHEAARRELKEELGVEVSATGDCVFTCRDPDSPFRIEFVPVGILGDPQALEHEALRWVDHAELLRLPMAPSDRAFAWTL